ncbi:MAG: serine hydrolase [Oliverpabstia sp.]|nr:serine hydrolase [Oliverpabstia sp.]
MALEKIFKDFIHFAQCNELKIESIAIADTDRVILEHRFTPDQERNIYSHTKSYMSMAAGIAIEEGKLSLSDKLADLFPQYVPENADPRLLEITMENLLTMTSGFHRAYLMGADRRAGIGFPDYMEYMMTRPILRNPGEEFCYSTADSILAGRMIEQATGQRLGEYLYRHVFSRLDQGWPQWENDPQGHPIGGGSMFMRLTEMMKLGQVFLANGKWKHERIISSEWVKAATTKHVETNTESQEQNEWTCGYGYQFWMSPYPGAYRADGAYGQISTVLPESGLVVAVQCPEWGDFNKVRKGLHEELLNRIVEE